MHSFYGQYEYAHAPRRTRITRAVQRLIIANIAVFAIQLLLDVVQAWPVYSLFSLTLPGGYVSEKLAFSRSAFVRGAIWMPFTYMFLHVGLWHLFLNMLCLFFFGPDVERVLSTRQFYRFYVICGAVGVLVNLVPFRLMEAMLR